MRCIFLGLKNAVCIFVILISLKISGFSQLKMSMDGDTVIHQSALLHLESTDRGILIPRMDSMARLNIQNPANGLLVYDSTYNDFFYYNGLKWKGLKHTSNLEFNISIKTPVCHGDSILFKVMGENCDDFWWVTPTNDTLQFRDSSFIVQPNSFVSGIYEANIIKNNVLFKKYQWVTINECEIIANNDILMYSDNYNLHKITSNDHDNNNIREIRKINGQIIYSNSTVYVGENHDVAIRINQKRDGIFILPETDSDQFIEFNYEVCDYSGYCDESKVIVLINKAPNHFYITRDSFYNLINQTNTGDTLDLQNRTILVSGNPLDITKSIVIKNARIKRSCTKIGTTSAMITPEQSFVLMNTPHEFFNGEWILPVFGPGVDQNSGGQILQITNIVEDTIFIYQNFLNEVPAGSNVIIRSPLVRLVHDSISCVFENVIFDGSKDCNNFTYDWKFNYTITINENDTIKNCVFINTPCENIFMCGGCVKDCRAYNLNGSFIHASCGVDDPYPSLIQNNYTNGVCLVSVSQNGHNEGWFTYSSNTRNFIVTDNFSYNGGESCFGSQELDDYNNTFTNNTFGNFKNKKNYIEPGHFNPDNINNNIYINVPEE